FDFFWRGEENDRSRIYEDCPAVSRNIIKSIIQVTVTLSGDIKNSNNPWHPNICLSIFIYKILTKCSIFDINMLFFG
ncbi:hypothetical protein ACUOA9_40825, partial [Escherichia sp. HC-TM1]